jgi:hypothetical protein
MFKPIILALLIGVATIFSTSSPIAQATETVAVVEPTLTKSYVFEDMPFILEFYDLDGDGTPDKAFMVRYEDKRGLVTSRMTVEEGDEFIRIYEANDIGPGHWEIIE